MISEGSIKPILIFDLGNVMVRLNSIDALWPELVSYQTPVEKLKRSWSESPAVRAYESGQIQDFREFYSKLKDDLAVDLEWSTFRDKYNQIIGSLYPETLPLLQKLTGAYPLYLLSNTSPAHWNYVNRQDDLTRFFRKCYLSYELGVMKPDPLIFEQVFRDIPSIPQNIYFFDDRSENTEAAALTGVNAFEVSGGKPLLSLLGHLHLI